MSLIDNALSLRRNKQLTPVKINETHRSFDRLLKEPATNKESKELITFQKRLVKYQDYVFAFLDNPEIPPDNNGSERAIRNFKVKQKNSGFFKSIEGANIYAVIRYVIDTALKNGQPLFKLLQQINHGIMVSQAKNIALLNNHVSLRNRINLFQYIFARYLK